MTVTTTPSIILPEDTFGGSWLIQNIGEATIYLGRTANGADPDKGIKVAVNQALTVNLGSSDDATLWAATDTGEAEVRVLRMS